MASKEAENQRRQQQIINEREDSGFSTEGIVGAAVASAAATALFFRSGGASKFARALDAGYKYSKELRGIADRRLSGENVTISNYRNFFNDAKSAWQKVRQQTQNTSVNLNIEGNNFFKYAHSLNSAYYQHEYIARQEYRNKYFEQPVKDFFNSKYDVQNMDYNRRLRFNNYINQMSRSIGDAEDMVRTKNSFKFAQEDLPIVNALDRAFTKIQNSLSGDEENSIRKQVNKQFEEAVKQGFNIDKLEQEFGSSRSKTFIDKLVETTLKDRAATTRDILESKDKIRSSFTYSSNKDKQEQLIDTALNELEAMRAKIRKEQGEEAEQRFLDLTPDNSVRVDAKGRLYSVDSVQNIKNDLITFGASTLPGKILKLGEIRNNINTPSFYYFAKGSLNPILAGKLNQETNRNNQILDASYYQIGKELYKLNDDTLEKMDNVDDLRLISGRYGATQRLLSQLTGNTRYQESSNKIFRLLDIGQDREDFSGNLFSRLRSRFNKKGNEDWRGNVFNRILHPTREQTNELLGMYQLRNSTDASIKQQSFSYAVDYLQKAEYIENFLKENTYELSRSTIDKIMPNASKEAQNYLNVLLNNNNEDMVHDLMSIVGKDIDSILNNDLNRLINRLIRNQTRAQSSISLRTDRANVALSSNLSALSDIDFGNESAGFYQQLRTEISKEVFLQHALSNSDKKINGTFVLNHDSILDLLKASGLDRKEEIDTRRLALLTSFQEKTGINNIKRNRTTENIWKEVTRIDSVLHSSDNVIDKEIRNTVQNLANEQISSFESISNIGLNNIENPQSYPEWVHIGTGVGPIELIKSLNDSQKVKSNIKKMFTQFNAGRDNLADITTYTETPYFFMSRLSDALNTFGLGFSRDSMGSSLELLGSFAFKRIMPVAFGATYLEWADDTSQELTGTSIAGAAANGIANVDLAFRRFSDTIGLTDWLKEEKQINPIMQYWGDHNEFMSYEERKKWYESGYEPVRKGAWWTFGGVSEARGSEITYWQPSFARRINSDYLDKSLYDGYFDKWSHSLLPTPTNPLSPLFALLDPYWLEEKHEDDRPYPISGPMFAEGTPWGAILNPTIGELIKPEKELHPWRLNNGIDAFALIHQINNYIKTKATDITETNAFAISGSSITPVSYTDYNAPTEDSHIYSVQISNDGKGNVDISGRSGIYGKTSDTISNNAGFNKLTPSDLLEDAEDISTTGYMYNAIAGTNYPIQNGAIITNEDGEVGTLSFNTDNNNLVDTRLGLADSLTLDAIINGDDNNIKRNLRDLVKSIDPKEIIFRQNTSIKQKASANINALNDEEGFVSPEKLRYFTPSQGMDLLNDPTTVTELINASKGADFVKDIETSSRLISGIYGYMLGSLTGFGNTKGDKIAQSSNMTSFSRTFWDSNIGGAGGDVMEIVRRFIPSYKSGLNPLMNEMPDWLPERFRFGDPFSSIPKGEMRLPGKGYESLNRLHPDMYGDYGAFDRFKILADISPFSPEFRLWRQIAKQTVTDPNLIAEMDEITDRVNQQGKKHDFYDYKVVGRGLEFQNIVVSEVLGYGKFRSGDTIYKLAGAKVKGNADETMTDVLGRYIHPGDEITIAIDSDMSAGTNNDADSTINAAVFNQDGQNIAQLMLQNGDASKKKGDTSAPATLVNYSGTQKIIAYASEVIAHADVPWLSDQFLRVRTPLESYEAEQVYGTPYQSWEHPINTFLMPAIERAIHEGSFVPPKVWTYLRNTEGIGPYTRKALDATFMLTNRGAFIGAALSNLYRPYGTKDSGSTMTRNARLGANLVNIGHFLSGGTSYIGEMYSGAMIGYDIGKFLEKELPAKYAAIGALIGASYRFLTGDDKNWIPDRTKEKWEIQEYFDRLTYLKYMGLYHMTAERAKDEEDIDIEDLLERNAKQEEKRQAQLGRMKSIKEALRKTPDSPERQYLMDILNNKINALATQTSIVTGGEWTHTALIYRQAAQNTMTALKPGSSWSQIVTALPTNDREYFMEFVKERNPEKRQEIMRTVSPQLRKALNLAWGRTTEEPDIDEENENFFSSHVLPSGAWIGWRPDIDLKDVEVKTIANEGMNLSDFGFYESQLRQPEVINAPEVHLHGSTAELTSNLKRILEGQGLEDVDISISSASAGTGHQIIANIGLFTGLKDLQSMTDESLKYAVN